MDHPQIVNGYGDICVLEVKMYRLIPIILILQFAFCYVGSANWLEEADAKLYHLIHDHRTPLLDQTMPWVSKIGGSEYEIGIAFILPFFGVSKEASYTSITAALGAGTITFLLKGLINRPRPTGVHGRWNSSFPSGHASTAYAMASVWGAAYPNAKLPLYLIAALIAYSRIYNGRHYPMDVLAGAGIGYLCGRLAWRYKGIAFKSKDHLPSATLNLTRTRRTISFFNFTSILLYGTSNGSLYGSYPSSRISTMYLPACSLSMMGVLP